MAGFETLLGTSNILVYGRILTDITLVKHDLAGAGKEADKRFDYPNEAKLTGAPPRAGANKLLEKQLDDPDASLARIYGFSYEGQYYDLTYPVIMVVHGTGAEVDTNRPRDAKNRSVAHPPTTTDTIGVTSQSGHFARDMRVWAYDKADFSLRMDVTTGTLEELLLEADLIPDSAPTISGANVRGANVRGANVRGANVRGANVRGANVRGANVRGGGSSD